MSGINWYNLIYWFTKLEFDLFSGFAELKKRFPGMQPFTDLPSGLWVEKSWKWLEKKWNLTEKGRNKGNLIQCMMSRCIFCLCEPVGHGAAFSEVSCYTEDDFCLLHLFLSFFILFWRAGNGAPLLEVSCHNEDYSFWPNIIFVILTIIFNWFELYFSFAT